MLRTAPAFLAPVLLLLVACGGSAHHPAPTQPATSTAAGSAVQTPAASSRATPPPIAAASPVASPAAAATTAHVTVFAGAGPAPAANRDGRGTDAVIFRPDRLTVDRSGTLYVAGALVKTVSPDATVTTLQSSPGLKPTFGGLLVDPAGNVLLSEDNSTEDDINPARVVRRATDGTVTVLAGGQIGFADGVATAAKFDMPAGPVLDSQGNLYVADRLNHRLRKIAPDCTVSTVAGSGATGEDKGGFDDGPATAARFNLPSSIAIDGQGVLYVGDLGNHRIRRVTPDGRVSTLAGSGRGESSDGRGAAASFAGPYQLAVDTTGTLYVADGTSLRRVTADGTVTTLAAKQFQFAVGLAVGQDGALYVADRMANQIDKVTLDGVPPPAAVPVPAAAYCSLAGAPARTPTPAAIPAPSTKISETATDNAFSAKVVAVPANQPVTLTVVNKGIAIHNLHVTDVKDASGKDIKTDLLSPGKQASITFTIDEPGMYRFQDDVHPTEQTGTLYVVGPGATPSR